MYRFSPVTAETFSESMRKIRFLTFLRLRNSTRQVDRAAVGKERGRRRVNATFMHVGAVSIWDETHWFQLPPLNPGAHMTQQELEKEVARLKIRLETLVSFLESWPGGLGSPFGRADYERDVRAALVKESLE
jgi:hypothetical protein